MIQYGKNKMEIEDADKMSISSISIDSTPLKTMPDSAPKYGY
jgi:hypothetical protein